MMWTDCFGMMERSEVRVRPGSYEVVEPDWPTWEVSALTRENVRPCGVYYREIREQPAGDGEPLFLPKRPRTFFRIFLFVDSEWRKKKS